MPELKVALSTNWCNRRIEDGRVLAETVKAIGFDALELGFHTTAAQAREIRACGVLPIQSIHAFCPVPLSAPQGYPELYLLADFDEAARGLARVHVRKNIEFAAEMGADAVVLHAGRVPCRGFLKSREPIRRRKRGRKLVEIFKRELEILIPVLEHHHVKLGLENLPYREGFPDESELPDLCGDWVRPWFDSGHDFVRRNRGWTSETANAVFTKLPPIGLHIHDSVGGDDHLPPGEGKIDFLSLRPLVESVPHLVFEPHTEVSEEALKTGLAYFRKLFR